jgi:hypothetical protein
MMTMLMAYRQRSRLPGHDVWIAQRVDDKWHTWIEGEKAVESEALSANQEEANKVVHSLAHWQIEGKHSCICADVLRWQSAVRDLQ